MLMPIIIVIGFIIVAGLVTDLIERCFSDGRNEFCKIECSSNKIIYK